MKYKVCDKCNGEKGGCKHCGGFGYVVVMEMPWGGTFDFIPEAQ